MATTRELLDAGTGRLREAGSETARLDAELLLAFANGVDRTAILAHPEAQVGVGPEAAYEGYLARRAAGEPVAYIRGIKEFHGLAFGVDPRALIPRPETELLVDLGLAEVMRRLTMTARTAAAPALQVLDVGTGSGAVAVALAVALRARRVPPDDAAIVAVDISPDALDLARENAVAHAVGDRLRFVAADLFPPGTIEWALVLANLPYVSREAMGQLPAATTFEPALALDGGQDGLEVIGRLVDRLPSSLAIGGVALLEIGADQAADIGALADARLPGWTCTIVPDLAGLPRVARLERPAVA
jgi:release factor glutamine methyltransferase